MASRERIKKRKVPGKKAPVPVPTPAKKPELIPGKSKVDDDAEDTAGSQVSVREASRENITDNTRMEPVKTSTPLVTETQTEEKDPSKSSRDFKKKKKDHVEQKREGRHRSPSPNPSLSAPGEKKRAPSPSRKNVVNPINVVEDRANMGSAVSIRTNASYSSLKEAWVENENKGAENDQKKRGGKVSPLTNMSPSTNASSNPATGKLNTLQGIKGIKVNEDEVEEEDSPEKHAYIPYLYARTCIAKIMEDMKKMKGNHLVIVESIQHQYRTVENDTQTQFNMFVICLREEYATKQKTFRQVIDLHRAELERKEKYWNEMLASLAERNNRLLKEKKVLLLENTTEIERLVKEKDQVRHDMGEKIDKLQAAPVPVPVPTGWESEKKILEDELSSEKMEKERLQEQLSAGGPTEVTSPSVYSTEVSQKHSLEKSAAGTIVVAGVLAAGKEDRKRMDLERQDMDEERQALGEERKAFEMERESFDEDQKKWMGQISDLQENLGAKNVESGEWKVKYDTMKTRLDEAAGIQAKYQTLESQYQALALLVSASDNKVAAQEQAQKTHDEKVMMDEEKQKMEKEIGVWEKHFEKKNGRKPTEEDKNDSVTEMYVQREELQFMVNSLEKKEATLKAVESGHVPEPPEVPPPVNNKEPEVVTVQVKVPDPTITMELSKSQEMVITLRTQITTLHQEISELNGKISQQNQELSKQRGRIVQLENDVAALRAGGATAASTTTTTTTTSSSASNEETEALKKENRELRTDMKKMIKQYERMKERDKVKADGEEGSPEQAREVEQQLHSLDNKVADLEAENETLREEKVILKERIRTEVITITHMEERGKELDQMEGQMEDLSEELERVKQENHEMHKDMKKMIKTHNKMKAKLEHLQGSEKAVHLLEIVSMMVHQIHKEVPDAASKVNTRLDDVENEVIELKQDHDAKKMAADMWNENYKKTHGNAPGEKDRDAEGEAVYKELDEARKQFKDKMLHISALQLMKTGDIRKAVDRPESVQSEVELEKMEKQLVAADDKMIDLETENGAIKSERDKYKEKINDLEQTLDEMKNQAQVQAMLAADTESSAELTEQLSEIQKKCDRFEAELMQEKMSHVNTQEELENVKNQMNILREEIENEKKEIEVSIQTTKVTTQVEVEAKEEELKEVQQRLDVLETERLSKLPPDTAAEIKTLQEKLKEIKQERSSTSTTTVVLETSIKELTTKLETTSKNLETQRAATRELESKMKNSRHDKEKEVKKMSRHLEEKEHNRTSEDKNRINMLVKRVKELEAVAGKGGAVAVGAAAGRAAGGGDQGLKEQNMALKMEIKDLKNRIKQLETDLRSGGGRPGTAAAGGGAADRMKGTRPEKILKELEKKLDYEKNKSEKLGEGLKAADEENKALKKELDEKSRNLAKVQAELKTLGLAAKEGVEAATKVKDLETDNKKLTDENNSLLKNFESERVLRKKYYNMVEDMKGKIRVYCRARPLSGSEKGRGNKAVVTSLDEYSINVVTARGMKDFQYDQVFMEDSTQEKIFEDTNNLIQSAVDGYNVCIFAYGQTGSGKTFTMIGDRAQQYPGIAPRAFNRVFELIHELRSKFVIEVEVYMLELYNEKLIDLFARPGMSDDEKLDIKKDKKGLVYIQGSVVKAATNAKELFALFEDGSANRHVASTKMNAESSRSHLVVGITMECTNRNTGTVTKGKLSLVDLAGSERVAKTQAGAEQLKEAMSINKSLSALGDVISALSSEQSFIPYRNNKLTMLMQDSLGGNAKTLMFVNVSPADYNADETVVSLTYASRVKLITNDASKNADNKEISRLKAVISKLKQGEKVDEEEAS